MLILHRDCIYIAKLSQNKGQSNITVAIIRMHFSTTRGHCERRFWQIRVLCCHNFLSCFAVSVL